MSAGMDIAVNARFTTLPQGGQQRVGAEILKRLQGQIDAIAPRERLEGMKGHLWEQAVLPLKARGRLLWSPSATGPILHEKQVVTLHDIAYIDAPEFFSANFVRLYSLIMPLLLKRAAHIVTVSAFSRQRIIEHYRLDPTKVTTIYNGTSASFCRFEAAEIAAVRSRLQLPERYLLLQATADRRKNLARVLEAWSLVQNRMPADIALIVSGRVAGSHVFGAAAALPDTPRTRFLGFVEDADLGPLIGGATGFLFPSLYEGFGLPIIEAFACGTPVITGNTSAMPEVAAGAAILIDPTSTFEIGEAMLRLVADEDLRADLSRRGLARASDFSWDRAAAQYQTLFNGLM